LTDVTLHRQITHAPGYPQSYYEVVGREYRGFNIVKRIEHNIYDITNLDGSLPPNDLQQAFTMIRLAEEHIDMFHDKIAEMKERNGIKKG
jgi:hypothetical protein